MSYTFNVGMATDTGYVREINEDYADYADNFFVVCDGMGGHDGGEIASSKTVQTLVKLRQLHGAIPPELSDMQQWLTEANREVFNIASGRAGTTLTMLAEIQHDDVFRLAVANVGDSRTYRFSATDELTQITRDHSAVAELVRMGQLTEAEARVHPARNVITRAVGSSTRLMADVVLTDAVVGDRFVLCTDGLTSEVDDLELASIIASHEDPQELANALIETALEHDGSDNITVLVADVSAVSDCEVA